MQFGLHGLHDLAHLLGRGRFAERGGDHGDGFSDQNAKGGIVESLGQELLDDHDLGGFGGGQLWAVAVGELLDGVAARFSMNLFLRAFLMRRRVVVRVASWAFMARMTCWLTWASSAPAPGISSFLSIF